MRLCITYITCDFKPIYYVLLSFAHEIYCIWSVYYEKNIIEDRLNDYLF